MLQECKHCHQGIDSDVNVFNAHEKYCSKRPQLQRTAAPVSQRKKTCDICWYSFHDLEVHKVQCKKENDLKEATKKEKLEIVKWSAIKYPNDSDSSTKLEFHCLKCKQKYHTSIALIQHIKNCHLPDLEKELVKGEPPRKKRATRSALNVKVAVEEQPGNQDTEQTIDQQIVRFSTPERPLFKCLVCQETFLHRQTLDDHMSHKHGSKAYPLRKHKCTVDESRQEPVDKVQKLKKPVISSDSKSRGKVRKVTVPGITLKKTQSEWEHPELSEEAQIELAIERSLKMNQNGAPKSTSSLPICDEIMEDADEPEREENPVYTHKRNQKRFEVSDLTEDDQLNLAMARSLMDAGPTGETTSSTDHHKSIKQAEQPKRERISVENPNPLYLLPDKDGVVYETYECIDWNVQERRKSCQPNRDPSSSVYEETENDEERKRATLESQEARDIKLAIALSLKEKRPVPMLLPNEPSTSVQTEQPNYQEEVEDTPRVEMPSYLTEFINKTADKVETERKKKREQVQKRNAVEEESRIQKTQKKKKITPVQRENRISQLEKRKQPSEYRTVKVQKASSPPPQGPSPAKVPIRNKTESLSVDSPLPKVSMMNAVSMDDPVSPVEPYFEGERPEEGTSMEIEQPEHEIVKVPKSPKGIAELNLERFNAVYTLPLPPLPKSIYDDDIITVCKICHESLIGRRTWQNHMGHEHNLYACMHCFGWVNDVKHSYAHWGNCKESQEWCRRRNSL